MSLITGSDLQAKEFFSSGNPKARASSFDLSIGTIFDHKGVEQTGSFNLKPGQMVQVVSAEIFKLPNSVTGHVTYKTQLTKKGIWALTVGIVDPGWDGPVSTTLLNFSRVEHTISPGDAFLRVSFFKHGVVASALPAGVKLKEYLREMEETAMTRFPKTFLNKAEIAKKAKKRVFNSLRTEAIGWLAAIALVFTGIQVVLYFAAAYLNLASPPVAQVRAMQREIDGLDKRIEKYEQASHSAAQGGGTSVVTGAQIQGPPAPPASGGK